MNETSQQNKTQKLATNYELASMTNYEQLAFIRGYVNSHKRANQMPLE